MSNLTHSQITAFQTFIFSWWQTHRRDLPWRQTHDPYKILVSELMLQQTQVARVLPKYQEFLLLFPDVFALSTASTSDVLIAWKGMGYNRRALYLKKLSEIIVQKYDGAFPQQEKDLLTLPGLGRYTARAILVFAYQQNVSMIDTNIRQIIVHHFFNDQQQKESIIQEVADQLIPPGKSWDWHQALMDYGALEMTVIARSQRRSNPLMVKEKSQKYLQSKLPFKQTNRFFRGRMIDFLREKSYSESDLLPKMEQTYGKDQDFQKKILADLLKEGLIERSKTGIISLPK